MATKLNEFQTMEFANENEALHELEHHLLWRWTAPVVSSFQSAKYHPLRGITIKMRMGYRHFVLNQTKAHSVNTSLICKRCQDNLQHVLII